MEQAFLHIAFGFGVNRIAFLKRPDLPNDLLVFNRAWDATGGTPNLLSQDMAELMIVRREENIYVSPSFELSLGARQGVRELPTTGRGVVQQDVQRPSSPQFGFSHRPIGL